MTPSNSYPIKMSQLSVILITGANQGLGWHACQQLARAGTYHILLGARDPQKGTDAVNKILASDVAAKDRLESIQIDIKSDASIDAAVAAVQAKFGRLDVLVNNAGTARATDSDMSLRAQYQEVFDLNVFSHVMVTEKFLPLLRASTSLERRVVFTSSSVGSMAIGQDEKHPFYANNFPIYRTSKSATNMLMVYYANILKAESIAVVSVCPGHCATAFNGYRGTDSPESGAAAIVKAAAEGTNEERNGVWMNANGPLPF